MAKQQDDVKNVAELIERHPEQREFIASLKEPQSEKPLAAPQGNREMLHAQAVSSFYDYRGLTGTNNTCGQAAIAAVADRLGLNIMPRRSDRHWDNDPVIKKIMADGFRPDVMGGGLGTTGGQIANALKQYKAKNVTCGYVGAGGILCQGGMSWQDCWNTVKTWVNAGWPVPVMIDANFIFQGGPPLGGHWPIVINVGGGVVTLANCNGPNIRLPEAKFLSAWNYLGGVVCGYSHCFVVAQS